jgi:hypothetical protein
MPGRIDALPPEVVEAWRAGRKIEAIRILREKTGAGLAEAKAAVDALDRAGGKDATALNLKGSLPEVIAALSSLGGVPPEVAEAWRRGDKMAALKWLREHSRTGAAVARMEASHGEAATLEAVRAAGAKLSSLGLGHEALSPGEVPRAKGGSWLFVVLALVLLAVWVAFTLN